MALKGSDRLRVAAVVVLVLQMASIASAQTAPSKWEVGLVGGLSRFELPTGGTSALPPAGPPLTTSGPTNPSRQVPTWFLGDGANLINGVNAEFGVPARITPLDSALVSLGLGGTNAPVFGIRIRRVLTDRLSLEMSAEVLTGSREVSPELIAAAETSRASFEAAFVGLLSTGPFTNASVNASIATVGQSSRDLATTAAVRWTFSSSGVAPYLTFGGGLVRKMGDLPGVTLSGHYAFQILGSVPIDETDTLRVRYDQGSAFVGVAGIGLRRGLTDRIGLVVDGRVLVGQQTLSLTLDSESTVASGSPAGFIESFTTPAVQFSNSAATGRASSLSGQPLNGFKAFSTSGLQVRYLITTGITLRF